MSFVKDFFTFNKREQNGIFILSFIIILLLAYNFWLSHTQKNPPQPDFSEFENAIKEFYQTKHNFTSNNDTLVLSDTASTLFTTELFTFNPNTASDEDFKRLGLSEKQIKNIRNYLTKYGTFRFKNDFGKLYTISDSLFEILNPYIELPLKETYYASNKTYKEKQEQAKIDKAKPQQKPLLELNSADSMQLIEIKGIGPTFASRIIKYRTRLGGFERIEQLLEVYGMKEEQFELIKTQVKVNPSSIKKININTCSAAELKNHPYINNANTANALINFRKKHGLFKNLDEIKKCDLVNDELYLKLAPYITLD